MLAKKLRYLIVLLALFPVAFLLGTKFSESNLKHPVSSADLLTAGTQEKFEYLAKQTSNACGLQPTAIDSYPAEARLQGSCCAPMDLHRYQEQVEGLKKYSKIPQIPTDPYDILVAQALELLDYQQNIKLTAKQQVNYDEAVKLSEEGGPCCCRCWRWDAFEGLAKFLITQYNFGAEQVAEVWDLEDGCGGASHEHET